MKKYTIRWTENASITYLKELEIILERWPIEEALKFEKLKDAIIENLEKNSKFCPEIKKFKLRKCVISKQTSLVYRIVSKEIELIAFVHNRSGHNYFE